MRKTTIIYVASELRSGSTLLDRLVSNHSEICTVGELANLHYYLNQSSVGPGTTRNWVCRCGQPLIVCPFWTHVAKRYYFRTGKPMGSIKTSAASPKRNFSLVAILAISLILPARLRRKVNNIIYKKSDILAAKNCFAVYGSIRETAGKAIFVDSSKKAEQLYSLSRYLSDKYELKVIHIVRDGRAVASSVQNRAKESKKEISFGRAAANWAISNMLIYNLGAQFKKNNFIRIKYEDLCDETENTMRRICRTLDINFEPTMSTLNESDNHNIGGTPRKFSGESTIKVDDSWKQTITLSQRLIFFITGGMINKFFLY